MHTSVPTRPRVNFMSEVLPPRDCRWLVFIASLPTEDPAVRMRVLRTLESLGAAVMREGAYLLPNVPSIREATERLVDYVSKNAGSAHALQAAALGQAEDEALRRMVDRSARYEELIKTIESLRAGYGISDPGAISRVLNKQRREFEAITALDFFPAAARDRAHKVLSDAEEEVRKLLFPAQAAGNVHPHERLLRRSWATGRPLWADRLACAWLIRRFVDPEATLVWLEQGQSCPPDAVGFALKGARFCNSGTRVTFEDMLAQLDMTNNAALARIGGIVHFLEVGGTPVPEAAGVQTLLQGAVRRATNSDELLHEAEKTFDLLYEAYCDSPKKR